MRETSDGSAMTPERWKRICVVLDRVLDAEPSQQDAVFQAACRTEGVGAEEVVRFVAATHRDPEFLKQLPTALVAEALGPLSERLPLMAGTRLGDYEVIAPIGAGAMGEIYRARDTKLHRDVALKVLPDRFAMDPDRLARFKREAQLLAALNHPNIAAIYGFEECDSAARPGETAIVRLVPREELIGEVGAGSFKSKDGVFGGQNWNPPPPPPTAAELKPPPPPPPTAPPLPFQYLGKAAAEGQWEVYLGRGEQTFVVKKGMQIDGMYRVDTIAPPTLTITYLPMNQVQQLNIGVIE